MDATYDRDIELQRASGELIEEFRTKLPPLLWKHHGSEKRVVHRWAKAAKVEKLVLLLDPFQEWPQLLDPHLNWVLTHLTDAFLSYLFCHKQSYASTVRIRESGLMHPLTRAICKIIYTLCKVRGPKVISRFFNNEPKYLEPMLSMFIEWDTIVSVDIDSSTRTGQGLPLNWEERYVMLLWLSHLLLVPFDLSSISSGNISIPHENLSVLSGLPTKTPKIALSVLSVALKYLVLPGKEREGAILVLSRLALRRDMQQLGILDSLVKWALGYLKPSDGTPAPSTFTCIGLLSFIAKLGTLAQVEDIAPYVIPIFNQILGLSSGSSEVSVTIQSSASTRKLLTKILREMTNLALTLEARSDLIHISSDEVSTVLEDSIDYLLLAVGDKDTPVRFAASKALSMIALKLDPDLGADIIDAVIGALEEDVLYEKENGALVSKEKAESMPDGLVVRNVKSVDAQKWHGLMLTLGHLLFRRSPPIDRLSQLLNYLISGLTFEQRSSTGASIGVTVRDVSCFGIWSLARKYSTKELESVKTCTMEAKHKTILRSLAIELVSSACLDPSGNIRRGSSAALQELIGRHPNSILEGISIVQIVDYHSVARREIAMTEVSMATARLDNVYWSPLIGGLLQWRGIGAPDPKSRRTAASAIGELSLQMSYNGIGTVLDRIMHILSSSPTNSVETRHGAFLALSATIDAFIRYRTNDNDTPDDFIPLVDVSQQIHQLWTVFDSPLEPSVESLTLQSFRPDLTAEACSRLISSLARSYATLSDSPTGPRSLLFNSDLLEKVISVLMLCVQRSDDEPVEASSQAVSDLFTLLSLERKSTIIHGWLNSIGSNRKKTTGRGQIAALGAAYRHFPLGGSERKHILDELVRCTEPEEIVIIKRVSAVDCIITGVLPHIDNTDQIENHIEVLLNDYTTDNRGDVGSLIRTEAIGGVCVLLESHLKGATKASNLHSIMKHVMRLAAEKLDKVRFKAWKCFQIFWESDGSLPPLKRKFDHFSEVSTADYFSQLATLLQVDWLRLPLIKGLVTSLTAGADSLINSSRAALVEFINSQDDDPKCYLCRELFRDLLTILEENIANDRYSIPTVEAFAFLLENCFVPEMLELDSEHLKKLFRLVQKSHFKSTNIPRIEAALKVYFSLYGYSTMRRDATSKMINMLLHPYPKIRVLASEYLFTQTENNPKPNHDLFSYTSGRFLYNEDLRLRERYIEFDVDALKESVTKHTDGGKVTNLVKLGEGGFNRVFSATLESGLQAAIKIPYPLSVPKRYATTSEVATLTFLRSKGIPVPKVYGWSATNDNAIGSEYIIMEWASGIGLDTKWFDMTKKQQKTVTLGIIDIEKTLFNISFGSIGSLYFKTDIPPELRANLYVPGTLDPNRDCDTFCIGPIADYMFWYGKRAELEVDHGPWNDPHQYLRAIGKRELEWTQKFGKPLEKDFPYNTLLPGIIPQERYAGLLQKYLTIAPFLLPEHPRDPGNQPTIRHPDLTPSNVFVSPETFEITCIIDWQHTTIIPLLLAAGHPKMFENPDAEPPETLGAPKPPEGYEYLDPKTKYEVDELLRRRYLYYLYRVFNGAYNKRHLSAFYDPVLQPRQHLVEYAGRQWSGNLITLQGALMRMCEYWKLLPPNGETCPISFTDAELKKHSEDEPMWFDLTALVNHWRGELGGLNEEGWIKSEMYEHAKKKNKALKESFISDADPDEVENVVQGWPFQDKEEFF
ncbi:hypothetical protein MaudCBS49596_007350 [Microsporum audouinii]